MVVATRTKRQEEKMLAELQRLQTRRLDTLGRLVEQAVLFEGKKGRGKSLSAVGVGYNLRELFGLHVIVVGSKMGIRPEFGPFEQMTEMQFLEKLELLTDIAENIDPTLPEEAIEQVLRSKGVNFMHSVTVFDEAQKLFECRTPSDKVVRLFGYFIDQMRHYHMTAILCSPHRRRIDGRVRQQLDFYGRCFMNKRKELVTVWVRGGGQTFRLKFHNVDPYGLRPNYYDMYNSWTLVGFRRKHLDIAEV